MADDSVGGEGGTVPALRRCHNPWKPHTLTPGQSEVSRRMLGILNRVTEQSLAQLLDQALDLPLAHPSHLAHVLALLLHKAQDEPLFSGVYARLWREVAARAGVTEDLSAACHTHFLHSHQQLLHYQTLLQGPVIPDLVHEEILARKRFIGHLKFMAELHKEGVMSGEQVAALAHTLLLHPDRSSLEALCRLLTFSGASLEHSHLDVVERSMEVLNRWLREDSLSPRLRFMVQDTLRLRANGWQPPLRPQGPPGRSVRG